MKHPRDHGLFASTSILLLALMIGGGLLPWRGVVAQPPAPSPDAAPARPAKHDPVGAKRIHTDYNVWLDARRKQVIVDGEVVLRRGPLEMFVCLKGTKEHESIIAVKTEAKWVHAALLAAGAKVGSPVQFTPKYKAASGSEIDIFLLWTDPQGRRHQARAQDWIRNAKTKKPLQYDWVFAGSFFSTDPDTGKSHYQAEGGDLICVSNFPSATLDLPIESSPAKGAELYEAWTERIPLRGTKVRLVLRPRPVPVKGS